MISISRVDSTDRDFLELVRELDNELNERYGKLQAFYDRFNSVRGIETVVVARRDSGPVGCGCFKPYDETTVEIKRMYVRPEHRREGIAAMLLNELEHWARELGFSRAVLETGNRQAEALRFYPKAGYHEIANFGQYAGVATSVCFAKDLPA